MEKSRLTYQYLQYSLNFYRDMRTEVQSCFDVLVEKGVTYLAFYGIGDEAEIAYVCLHGSPLELVGVIDDELVGEGFFGHPIQDRRALNNLDFDAVFVASLENAEQKTKDLLSLGIPREKIVRLGEDAP